MPTAISTASVNRNSGRELQASTCDRTIEILTEASKHQEPLIDALTAAVDSGDESTILQAAENLAAHRRNEPLAPAGKFEETPEETPEEDAGEDAGESAGESAGKAQEKSQEDSSSKDGATKAEVEVESVQKEKTVSKSIRLWQSAFAALKVLMGKYGMNMVDMVSTAIIAYAEKAAAAPILRYRIMDHKTLFPLQASATDIRAGLSNLGNDLYNARKSHRDPEERKAIYASISTKHLATIAHADETLTLMDKECLLRDLLKPGDHQILVQAVLQLNASKPKTRAQIQIRDLYLKIFETLLLP